jgi:hypothetical protein
MCTKKGKHLKHKIKEPGTGWKAAGKPKGLKGYADLHMHMFAHLAHGGEVLAGKPFHKNGVNAALRSCKGSHDTLERQTVALNTLVPGLSALVPSLLSGGASWHLPFQNDAATLGYGTNDFKSISGRAVDSHLGKPLFNGWPNWHSTIHQQVYYKWLERAWRGGMRLMVEFAVSNEALCKSMQGGNCENSMDYVDR